MNDISIDDESIEWIKIETCKKEVSALAFIAQLILWIVNPFQGIGQNRIPDDEAETKIIGFTSGSIVGRYLRDESQLMKFKLENISRFQVTLKYCEILTDVGQRFRLRTKGLNSNQIDMIKQKIETLKEK